MHGDVAGSVDRKHNVFATPVVKPDRTRESTERSHMDQSVYELDATRRSHVLQAIHDVCSHRGWWLFVAHVRTTHVHVIVQAGDPPEKVMSDFKVYASRRLNETGQDKPGCKRWARHGSTRYLWEQEDLQGAIRYVLHEQGEPMAVYAAPGVTRPSLQQSHARQQAVLLGDMRDQYRSLTVAAQSGFTMMEIAICLAIVGVALVAIIGVLPIGMSTQRNNRQETIIAQDASVYLEAIRNASLGMDDLTNYVYAISNYWTEFEPITKGGTNAVGINSYTYANSFVDRNYLTESGIPYTTLEAPLTNAANIIGVMSTPEFTDVNGNPVPSVYYNNALVYSNHVVVYTYSVSGLAAEKPPQDNTILLQDTFGYRIFCVNAPMGVNTNDYIQGTVSPIEKQLAYNLHELRLTFLWPQLPNGHLGSGVETFRTMIAGQLQHQPSNTLYNGSSSTWYNTNLYYYQSQWFTNAP